MKLLNNNYNNLSKTDNITESKMFLFKQNSENLIEQFPYYITNKY